MRKNKRTFRLTMLGILCGGLLLLGIGAGVCVWEAAGFTYGGEKMLDAASRQVETLVVNLFPEGPVRIDSYAPEMQEGLREAQVIQSADVDPGTAEVIMSYESVGLTADFWREEEAHAVHLSWTGHRRELAMLLAYKDQVLEDLKARRLSDYQAARLLSVEVRVHPDDAARIQVG